MIGNSKFVMSNQDGAHEELRTYLSRYLLDNYQRPIAEHSESLWKEILNICSGKKVIFDLGCGIGESTSLLAKENTDCIVIGIDKSVSRLERKNSFKEDLPSHCHLFRGELLDLIPLIYRDQSLLSIQKVYVLYPNPWPKKIHIKRRFHASPVAPFFFGIKAEIELRTNWEIYAEEFEIATSFYQRKYDACIHEPQGHFLTPFERKYHESQQSIFQVIVHQ